MNTEQYIEWHSVKCDELKETAKKKNSDYTGHSNDPFANFRRVEQMGICSVEVGFLTRMSDKMSRIHSLIQKGGKAAVLNESLEDTLMDLANYSILLAGYLESKKEEKTAEKLTLAEVRKRHQQAPTFDEVSR